MKLKKLVTVIVLIQSHVSIGNNHHVLENKLQRRDHPDEKKYAHRQKSSVLIKF